jgi:RNA polymerase sigma factor (sigma-70 family)
MMLRYSDEDLIRGLQQKKTSCIRYLYQEYGPVVRHLVKRNSGNQQDTEDLFQDAILVLFKRSQIEPFKLECSLKTYFTSICKNLWLQRLERKYRLLYLSDVEVHETSGPCDVDDHELREENLEQQRLFYRHLQSLPTECQRLLKLYCLKIPYKEIARLMHYKDEIYVKTRKYSCKLLLRKKIMNDPDCHQFFEYERYKNHQRLDRPLQRK